MITPKEKAEELYQTYGDMLSKEHNFRSIQAIKKCALITIEEVINHLNNYLPDSYPSRKFCRDVKTELEKL